MAAVVNVGSILVGAVTNSAGVFNGQNMQCDWDSHSPNISSLGDMMGNGSAMFVLYGVSCNKTVTGQPIMDQDIKSNGSPMITRP